MFHSVVVNLSHVAVFDPSSTKVIISGHPWQHIGSDSALEHITQELFHGNVADGASKEESLDSL